MFDFDWSFPYPSQRMTVHARDVITTSQPLAAEAGMEIFRRGGNAVDAAIATAITLTVVEPTSNGIGSDNFALVWKDGRLHGMNASGRAPAGLDPERFLTEEAISLFGWDPITVPGAPSGWLHLSQNFGSLPFADLFEPAIRYGREGFHVSPQTASSWRGAARRWPRERHADFHDTFLPGGRGPATGELRTLPDHAATLEAIAATKTEAFYRGELAERIEAAAIAAGAPMRASDLAAHRADVVEPISIDYHGWELHEIPPNGQGIAALIALGILRHFPMRDMSPDCVDSLHLQIESMKLAFRDAHRYVADPDHLEFDCERLLDDDYLLERSKLVDHQRATDFDHGTPMDGGTVLLGAADRSGIMISLIQSNYTGFGSGIVVPGTGISMQNRGGCFTPKRGHPNAPGPNKRPFHTIIPGFITRNGEPVSAFGVMGGAMQPQGHMQMLMRMADHKQNPQAALDAPRWQVTEGLKVMLEPGFPADTAEELRARGHDIQVAERRTVRFGGGQIIVRMPDGGYCAGSDLRRDGQAVGR
ncbi:MAG: gamma-glutamyltransferase family protein [Phycisphaerales bacterium]